MKTNLQINHSRLTSRKLLISWIRETCSFIFLFLFIFTFFFHLNPIQAIAQDIEVVEIQNRLNALGFDSGPIDGFWGKVSSEALRQFQKKNGLPATGKRDINSLIQLRVIPDPEVPVIFPQIGAYDIPNRAWFSPNGKYLIIPGSNHVFTIWDVAMGRELKTLKHSTSSRVLSISFSADGERVLAGDAQRTIKLWDLYYGHVLQTFKSHKTHIQKIEFVEKEKYFLVQSHCNLGNVCHKDEGPDEIFVQLIHIPSAREVWRIPGSFFYIDRVGSSFLHQVNGIMTSRDIRTGKVIRTLGEITTGDIKITKDGSKLLFQKDKTKIVIKNLVEKAEHHIEINGNMRFLSLSPDSKKAVSWGSLFRWKNKLETRENLFWGYGGLITVWDLNSGGIVTKIQANNRFKGIKITKVIFSPDSRYLLSIDPL